MRFVLPLLLAACGSVSAGDPCDIGGDTTRIDNQDYICQCNDDSADIGPCVSPGQWVPVNSAVDTYLVE